jgi:hypothetical protein
VSRRNRLRQFLLNQLKSQSCAMMIILAQPGQRRPMAPACPDFNESIEAIHLGGAHSS